MLIKPDQEKTEIDYEKDIVVRRNESCPLKCDGWKCVNCMDSSGIKLIRPRKCSPNERLCCEKLIRSVGLEPCEDFVGQFPTQKLDGDSASFRIVDFAIFLPRGNPSSKIAVELEDYESHIGNADKEKHNKDLKRRNSLELAGWSLLSITPTMVYDNNTLDDCRETLFTMLRRVKNQDADISTMLKIANKIPG
jgi:very-short-patch-repair endonuclease